MTDLYDDFQPFISVVAQHSSGRVVQGMKLRGVIKVVIPLLSLLLNIVFLLRFLSLLDLGLRSKEGKPVRVSGAISCLFTRPPSSFFQTKIRSAIYFTKECDDDLPDADSSYPYPHSIVRSNCANTTKNTFSSRR